MPPINQQQRSRNRYRPITSSDNAATTGLAVNPVGAMIPISDPTNGVNGAMGSYGAMNPTPSPNQYGLLGGVNVGLNYLQNTALPAYISNEQRLMNNYGQAWNNYQGAVSNVANNISPQGYGTLGFFAPGVAVGLQNSVRPGAMGGGASTQGTYTPPGGSPYWQLAAQSANGVNRPNFTSGNSFMSGNNVNLQPGLNNSQFVANIGAQILNDPKSFDNLPKSAQDAIRQSLGQDISGGVNADPANSPGGRFIQVGEVRWERNKNGRLVKVQYTGGGSWRNKKVVQGGKGQAKRRLAGAGGQAQVQPGSSNIPSYGVINMSLNTGTG